MKIDAVMDWKGDIIACRDIKEGEIMAVDITQHVQFLNSFKREEELNKEEKQEILRTMIRLDLKQSKKP
jgi:hypothetical protein